MKCKCVWVLPLIVAMLGCGSDEDSPAGGADAGTDATVEPDAPAEAAPEASPDVAPDVLPDVSDDVADADPIATITILHTGDEKGAVEPMPMGTQLVGGAANVVGWWKDKEGYAPDTHLVLSSGESWLGSASSTWLEGKNTVEVMNAMGYRAATLGPRDYDFGRDVIEARIGEAEYDFVSANTLYADTGSIVDYVKPYTIVPIDGIQVAVIGLMPTNHDVNPADVADLTFADYAPTVDKYAIEARSKGADVVVVLSSVDRVHILGLFDAMTAPVDVVFAGRYGQPPAVSTLMGEVPLVYSMGYWAGYHRVRIDVDRATRQVVDREVEWVPVAYEEAAGNPVTPDAVVEALVQQWEDEAAEDLGQEIGYAGQVIDGWAQYNWVTDAWLWAYPHADIAIQNSGGLKVPLGPGILTVGDLVEYMPHPNYIFEATMTGAQVSANLQSMVSHAITKNAEVAVAGLRYDMSAPGLDIEMSDGTPLDLEATYTVLVNSYVYAGEAGFSHDPDLEIVKTGAHYRDPVIAWTKQLGTSPTDPLETHIDPVARNH
jgi:2',3'-cyclic-nucleotide 2'-phosphodiesterase (5'-nucleotidase family)